MYGELVGKVEIPFSFQSVWYNIWEHQELIDLGWGELIAKEGV